MKLTSLIATFILFVAAASVLWPGPAAANEGLARADSVLAHIEVLMTEIRALKGQLSGLTGEDSLIIDHEFEYAQLRALDQVFLLIDLLAVQASMLAMTTLAANLPRK